MVSDPEVDARSRKDTKKMKDKMYKEWDNMYTFIKIEFGSF